MQRMESLPVLAELAVNPPNPVRIAKESLRVGFPDPGEGSLAG